MLTTRLVPLKPIIPKTLSFMVLSSGLSESNEIIMDSDQIEYYQGRKSPINNNDAQ